MRPWLPHHLAVVGAEDDDGVVGQALLLQAGEQAAELVVDAGDGGEVALDRFGRLRTLPLQ